MFDAGTKIHLQLPGMTDHQTLVPAMVLSKHDDTVTAIVDASGTIDQQEGDLYVHYHERGQFVRQGAHFKVLVNNREMTGLELKISGSALPAEKRKAHRVPTSSTDQYVRLGEKTGCELLDVSIIGCAISTDEEYEPGDVVEVALNCDGVDFIGMARIQNKSSMPGGGFRYGLLCLQDDDNNSLEEALHRKTIAAQDSEFRQQLADSPFKITTLKRR
ncbi:MAG: PilZ domain-containing protein [Phycisphaerae bacterium]|nr:PilZ domain-containing protein [Phycisphaerae bacterium]